MGYIGTHPMVVYGSQMFNLSPSGYVLYFDDLEKIFEIGDHGCYMDTDYHRLYLDKDSVSISKLWLVDIVFYSLPSNLEYLCLAGNELLTSSGISGQAMYRYQDAKNKHGDTHFQFIGSFKFLTRCTFYGREQQTNVQIIIRRL